MLLIDEVDKSDHEFESLLLEILSDFQVSIPEIGTVKARREPPMVFLTSNNTREISDALRSGVAFISTFPFRTRTWNSASSTRACRRFLRSCAGNS